VLEVHHRLIIRHPSRPAILALGDADGLRLPAFVSDDRHTAEVDYINRTVRERFALLTTVLQPPPFRSARRGGGRVHELQAWRRAPLPSGLHWCGRDQLASRVGREDENVIAEWLAAGAPAAVDGREWTLPGWFEEVWRVERTLAEAGVRAVHEIVQLRTWPSSCVLFVRTEAVNSISRRSPRASGTKAR
jgi:hypothetical protein